jgi:hypothetical protein
MGTQMHFTGGCLCGAVRYDIAADPLMAFHCQCRDCQRRSGAGHISALLFPAAAVKITGTPRYHATTADSGNQMTRGFCPQCGGWVFGKPGVSPDIIGVTAGSLDDPGLFKPQCVFFSARGQAWDVLDPALTRFATQPAG